MDVVRWGILSTGGIARQFARGLAHAPGAQLVAVGSRSQANADAFGDEFGVPRRYASYDALAADPDLDVIYIGTPHPFHAANSLLCIEAGKAVLCEKPFTLNARQASAVIRAARERGVFLMEALWTRFTPVMHKVRALLAEGAIGRPRMVTADFGFHAPFDPESRLFSRALGGGALLDVGVYPVSLASMVFGAPLRISTMAHLGATGVDEQAAMIFGYNDGALALLSCAITVMTPMEATITGERGMIRLPANWWMPQECILSLEDEPEQVFELPFTGNGYNYEALEVMRCLREGLLESPIMPLDETLALMQTLDNIRSQWGLRYPEEE
ncbi:MAG: Gfo/Idh/MocA family oxidoreductase [Aggregatilineales bacterium]